MKTKHIVSLLLVPSLTHAALVSPFGAEEISAERSTLKSERNLSTSIESPTSSKFLLIPAGTFMMGSTPEKLEIAAREKPEWWDEAATKSQLAPEQPTHPVTISQPFYISETLVTIDDYKQFVEATGYKTLPERDGKGGMYYQNGTHQAPEFLWHKPHPDHKFTGKAPVTQVSYEDAIAYCKWLSDEGKATYRLPTEAEWEYAARAGTDSVWFFGDDPADFDKFVHRGKFPSDVAQKSPNAFGLYDVHGNVWEWCSDWFSPNLFTVDPRTDPVGPDEGNKRVRRGGTYATGPTQSRSAFRKGSPSEYRGLHVGFRVVREIPSAE
ncbi:formylglycine-generating enzyme family protein [Haloferula sp.]|uniref:formylglycine-generating enzyme family protein n=1 Tax=Haloferula sp. TaxID=2497595 RepID=UPI003C7938CE